jgi:hypothetical protein
MDSNFASSIFYDSHFQIVIVTLACDDSFEREPKHCYDIATYCILIMVQRLIVELMMCGIVILQKNPNIYTGNVHFTAYNLHLYIMIKVVKFNFRLTC